MPPGEHFDRTTAERAHLQLLLACFRASPPPMRLPEVTGCLLPEVLAAGIIDPEVFRAGYAIMAARYEQLGIRALLPLERVWAGTCSAAGRARRAATAGSTTLPRATGTSRWTPPSPCSATSPEQPRPRRRPPRLSARRSRMGRSGRGRPRPAARNWLASLGSARLPVAGHYVT